MGDLKKGLKKIGGWGKKSLEFSKNAYTGGFVKDLFGGGGGGTEGIEQTLNEGTAGLAAAQAKQTQAGLKGLNAIKPAYAAARANVQVGKTNALQGAADRGVQAQSGAQQSLAARGLINSTIYDNATRGIASQTTRDLADIEQSYAQLLAQLDIGEGQAITQAQQFMSGTYGQQGQAFSNLKLQQAGIQASLHQDPDAWLDNILGIASTAVGVGIGKNL